MAQKGLFGEVLHAEGSYIHNLEPYWADYWNNWRLDYNKEHRGDIYATHGMGPACLALNIHRGDKMNYLVSMDTKAVGIPEYIKEKTGVELKDFRNGDHTMTMITQNPEHPTSTRDAVESAIDAAKDDRDWITVNDSRFSKWELSAHNYVPEDVKKALMDKYKNPIVIGIEEEAKEVGGHGGMDFIMDYRLIHCLQNGLPLDMDVYDLAEWSCLGPLTEISLDNNSAPVEIPDFTRGGWNKLKTVEFSK